MANTKKQQQEESGHQKLTFLVFSFTPYSVFLVRLLTDVCVMFPGAGQARH